jgi:hypothetical protein
VFRFLDCFRATRPSSAKPTPHRRASPRLGVEALEERMALSTASPYIHSVTDGSNRSAVFFINPRDDAFYEKDAAHGVRQLYLRRWRTGVYNQPHWPHGNVQHS